MESVMSLALAKTPQDVEQACLSRTTRTYDLYRHMYLRYTFVTVYVLSDGRIVDAHKHFVEQGGQTEHSLFIDSIEHPDKFQSDAFAHGPANSKPKKEKKHPKAKAKRSVELRKKLGPPLHEGPGKVRELDARSNVGLVGDAVVVDVMAASGGEVHAREDAYDRTKCLARIWAGGLLSQCKDRPKQGGFCGRHVNNCPHGRIDEDLSPQLAKRCKRPTRDAENAAFSASSKSRRVVEDSSGSQP